MSEKSLWFVAVCPACSRRNQFEINSLGCESVCLFCDKQFKAVGADSFSAALDDPLDYWIEFTDHGLIADESEDPGFLEFGETRNFQVSPVPRTPR